MTPAEVCKVLGIQASTLRKYSLLLEKEGVRFERSKNNSRKYLETHVIALQEATRLMDSTDMTLEKAIEQACKGLKASPIVEVGTPEKEPSQRHADDITGVLLEEIKSLKEQLTQQEMRLEQRDAMFVEILENLQGEIRELKEGQRQLNAPTPTEEEINAVESPPQAEPAPKQGFFARLFKK